jgi:hypothetical protein
MRLRPAARLALAVGVGGCHRAPADGAVVAGDAATGSPPDAEATLLPARCRRTDVAFALDEGQGISGLEVGDGVPYPGGYAVGFVHRAGSERVAAIALVRGDPIGLTRVVDLGPTMGDAPPPRIGWRAGELVAAAFVRPPETKPAAPSPAAQSGAGEATRDVALYAVALDATVAAPLTVPQRRDDSMALDVAFAGPAGLLVWDEATSAPRGVVKGAAFWKDHVAPARDPSPPESDAELPRVVPDGNGFAVIWIARRPEPALGFDGSASEATGEARAFGWLEMVAVDARGEPVGPVRHLTAAGGHVSAYDVESRGMLGGATPILLAVRDDGEAVDGSGGALLRVRVTGDTVEPPVAIATDGLGRGAPGFVLGADVRTPSAAGAAGAAALPALALAWTAKDEQARLLPLDSSGAPAAAPSAEDALSDARALLFAGAASGVGSGAGALDARRAQDVGARDVLVATPSDSAAQLRIFTCSR